MVTLAANPRTAPSAAKTVFVKARSNATVQTQTVRILPASGPRFLVVLLRALAAASA